MIKPEWEDAPEWASWCAQDIDNTWWWYENEPEYDGFGYWSQDIGNATIIELSINALNTLEHRP